MKKTGKKVLGILLFGILMLAMAGMVSAEELQKGLSEVNGKTYVYDMQGNLQTNTWTQLEGEYYYSDSEGVLVRNQIVKRGDSYCYVQEDGKILRKSWKDLPNGKTCYFGANGAPYVGVRKVGNKVYGFGSKVGHLKRNAWVKKGDRMCRTDATGEILRNQLIEVKGKYYYLGTYGARFTNKWKKFPEGRSYFTANGKRASGETKINGQLYYFNKKGYLVTGRTRVKAGNNTYYLDGKGKVEMKVQKTGSTETYYSSKGYQKNEVWARNYLTLQTAKSIVNKITTPDMSRDEKLDRCFMWVVSKSYDIKRVFTNQKGWPAIYANDHFLYGEGDCRADAAAFAYLAKALGYTKIYVCCDDPTDESHSWAEINGLVYDPLFWEAKGRRDTYYGGTYSAYGLWPGVRTAV